MSVRCYHAFKTVQKTISDQNGNQYGSTAEAWTCCNISTIACFSSQPAVWAFSRPSSFDNIAVPNTEGHRECIENDRLVKTNTVHRKVLWSIRYVINKSFMIKNYIVSTCKLFARVQLVYIISSNRVNQNLSNSFKTPVITFTYACKARSQNCDYWPRHVLLPACPTVRPHGKTWLPMDGLFWHLIF